MPPPLHRLVRPLLLLLVAALLAAGRPPPRSARRLQSDSRHDPRVQRRARVHEPTVQRGPRRAARDLVAELRRAEGTLGERQRSRCERLVHAAWRHEDHGRADDRRRLHRGEQRSLSADMRDRARRRRDGLHRGNDGRPRDGQPRRHSVPTLPLPEHRSRSRRPTRRAGDGGGDRERRGPALQLRRPTAAARPVSSRAPATTSRATARAAPRVRTRRSRISPRFPRRTTTRRSASTTLEASAASRRPTSATRPTLQATS